MTPLCTVHNVNALWKTGVSKTTNRPFAFWSCPQRNPDGSYCKTKWPEATAPQAKFDDELSQSSAMMAQQEKERMITRTAVVKSMIERGERYSPAAITEAEQWITFIETKKV